MITVESKSRVENILHEIFSPDDKKIAISHFPLLDVVQEQDYWHIKNQEKSRKCNCNYWLKFWNLNHTATIGCKKDDQK